jgi:glyoxylate carboligase
MAKMRAIDAAVRILEKEGVTCAFGVPGAAINPLYSALELRGSISHILARHVEGASHMAEGYTRARAGNIGVCIGTSGPAGTDMITGLYSAIADSIPILCITGQAPLGLIRQAQRGFDMDYQVQLSFENINAPELGVYGVDHVAVAKGLGCKAIRVTDPHDAQAAFATAREWMAEYKVPVVVEFILERVTNIAMGTEIDNIVEFEEIIELPLDDTPASQPPALLPA